MQISLGNKDYTFLIGYQREGQYRKALSDLAKKIFGLSFEDWYQTGYWNEKYIPYTLFNGDQAVANSSVNIMDFNVLGEKKRYIQIGTVLTDEAYRNQGLTRFLMEYILQEWDDQCDLIYLFANRTVLEMYPKFGFTSVKEYVYSTSIEKNAQPGAGFEKLNMDLHANRELLYEYAKNTKPFGKLCMSENADLVMFYCTSFLKDNVYYIKALDLIVVAMFNEGQLHLWDVFGKREVELDQVINKLIGPETNELLLGFTPRDPTGYEVKELIGDDTLFVQKDKVALFAENKLMFSLLSHA